MLLFIIINLICCVFSGGKVLIMPEVAEQDETDTTKTDKAKDVFTVEDQDKNTEQLRVKTAEKSGKIADKHNVVPADETKLPVVNISAEIPKSSRDLAEDATKTEEVRESPSAVKEEKLNEDIFAIHAEEELGEKEKTFKSTRDSLNAAKTDKSVSEKNVEVPIVNGVHEDLLPKEPPELVTVKEGYNLAAPKQKVSFAKEDQDALPVKNNIEQGKNGYKEQQTINGHVSGSLPLEVENTQKDLNTNQPKSPSKQNDFKNISDIPLAFNLSEAEKDSKVICSEVSHEREPEKNGKTAVSRTQIPQSNALSEKGGKTDVANQSPNHKKSRNPEDDSPWFLQAAQGGDLAGHKQSEVKEKQAQVVPIVTIDQSVKENEKYALDDLSESAEEHSEEDETPKRRRTSESDLSDLPALTPLSPLMEDQESNSTFLHPSGAKVKKSKSFVARGFSKMFGSKRKYKVDKDQKDTSDTHNKSTHEEFDIKENHNAAKKEKKKKKKEKIEKKDTGQTSGGDEKSPRKFGGLFSRGKKKEKHSH